MYGIGNRPAYVNYQYGTKGTKADAGTFNIDQPKRYFSSLDAEIYFSDYYVDEIIAIQYTVAQNNLPLFGYNSFVYDEIAVGNRIVQGQFSINFTTPGYLFNLLDMIKQDVVAATNHQDVNAPAEGTADEVETPAEQVKPSSSPLWNTTFDIDVMFGEESSMGGSKHVVLEGVMIGSCSLQVDTTGNPIAETYSFIARDIRTVE
ncbi:hypothetical protein [Heyndrickxia sporothermodurans]|uniref:hypothetical protein n=1 Tax=Heyndrickxia sporothermodurans TaxID=46224 RepID=UPI000D35EF46|nr:hypothetical protein [Heyndrickxia sporothermodurans]PTY92882.1 hypothetical protein B5V90_02050 [Heyndrickxia sporothermodurans]